MGNCCGSEDKDESPIQRTSTTPLSYGTDPSQYKTASRDEVMAATERRLAEQKAKNEIKSQRLRQTSAELPDNPNSREGGLRWQVG